MELTCYLLRILQHIGLSQHFWVTVTVAVVASPSLSCLSVWKPAVSESQPSPKQNTFKRWTFDSVHVSSVAMRPGTPIITTKGAPPDSRQALSQLPIETIGERPSGPGGSKNPFKL